MSDDTSVSSGGFEAALSSAAAAAGVDSPPAQPAASDPTPSAASQPTAPADPGQSFGPVPYERFSEVNRRMQAAEARARQREWADQYQPEQIQQLTTLAQRMRQDPVAFAEQLIGELQAHPEHSPRVKSIAAKLLAAARGQASQDVQPAYVNPETGDKFYTAEQMSALLDRERQRIEGTVGERLKPFESYLEQQRQQQAYAKLQTLATQDAKSQYDFVKDLPGFTEHKGAIKQALADHADWSAYQAYLHVFKTAIYPRLSQREQAHTLASLQQKAGAATLNPAQTPTTTGSRPKSAQEALERAYASAGG